MVAHQPPIFHIEVNIVRCVASIFVFVAVLNSVCSPYTTLLQIQTLK